MGAYFSYKIYPYTSLEITLTPVQKTFIPMHSAMNKVWYASSGKWFIQKDGEPMFFKPHDFALGGRDIENHWEEIKPELQALVKETDKQFTSNSLCRLNLKTIPGVPILFLFWQIRATQTAAC